MKIYFGYWSQTDSDFTFHFLLLEGGFSIRKKKKNHKKKKKKNHQTHKTFETLHNSSNAKTILNLISY